MPNPTFQAVKCFVGVVVFQGQAPIVSVREEPEHLPAIAKVYDAYAVPVATWEAVERVSKAKRAVNDALATHESIDTLRRCYDDLEIWTRMLVKLAPETP